MTEHVKKLTGLNEADVAERLRKFGFNELPSAGRSSPWQILFRVVREPMFIFLLSCGSIYIALGDKGEGFMLLSSVLLVVYISFFQQRKTENALAALRKLSAPRALVIRNGIEKRIAGRDVVKDDIILLHEGDRVCADAIVLQATNLKVDESILTGESFPVSKSEQSNAGSKKNDSSIESTSVYSGTLIVQGTGMARVTSTGISTRIGIIGKLLDNVRKVPTLLQQETTRIIKVFSVVGLILCIIVTITYGLLHGNWIYGILAGLSLAIAMLPEEFAIVLIIFTTLGAWRMSKRNVLTREPAVIETLGAVTVLCADKTGTLTQNRMSIQKLYSQGECFTVNDESRDALPGKFSQLIEYGILSSQQSPFDTMEKAILSFGKLTLAGTKHLHSDWKIEKEYPLTHEFLSMSRAFKEPSSDSFVIAAKGSPEAIISLCHLDKEESDVLNRQIALMASDGMRILGVAKALFTQADLPESQHNFNFEFIGLLGFQDPLRDTIKSDLLDCYAAGVRVIMITGDYPITAQYIARSMGLKNPEEVITGSALKLMDKSALSEKIKTVNIFARVSPEQKLQLVNALKGNGEVVAMTGDGVNDSPSLKAANIGIAMGQRGTDVAREASALVLLDDNFSSIVTAIRLGRKIYDNIKRAMVYVFAVHIPIAGLALIPVVFPQIPLILLPLHIAFLELIIDPTCSLIFEAEEEGKGIMNRAPRKVTERVLGRSEFLLGALQGLTVTLITGLVCLVAFMLKRPEEVIRAMTFTTLVVANIGLILINRSWTETLNESILKKNPALKWVVIGVTGFLFMVLYTPLPRKLFHLDFLPPQDIAICFFAGIASVVWFEIVKIVRKKKDLSRVQYEYQSN
ncbi:ATPase [Cytophagales bacterium WSM2-2]|nr:ATPase [Cytophagales bacterium WSM2-2]